MNALLPLFIGIPLLGLLVGLALPARNERLVSAVTVLTISTHFAAMLGFVGVWFWRGHVPLDTVELQWSATGQYRFVTELYFDRVTALFGLVGSFLTLLVSLYSRIYLHREAGYKRFFCSVVMFFAGYNTVVFAGNLDTVFVGWEVLGISSFLLVAFYRDRYLPARNALKVFTVYRFGDAGLILSIWASHHIFHFNVGFAELAAGRADVTASMAENPAAAMFLALMLLLAAAAKSAQLPFSSWLPRAMEGPTPSTAIFYGSLSVHIGVFLLLRTFPLWEAQTSARVLVGLVGAATALVATGIARVQPSVKAQIAYSSVAQLGLMFIELSLGLHTLALLHFAGNAFLRTYQLLVSPSVVSYLIREQFYRVTPSAPSTDPQPGPWRFALYMLCLREWDLDRLVYRALWSPLKRVGRRLGGIASAPAAASLALLYALGCGSLASSAGQAALGAWREPVALGLGLVGLALVLRSLGERRRVTASWALLGANYFWIALALACNEPLSAAEAAMYLGGVTTAGIGGWLCLRRLSRLEGDVHIAEFSGHAQHHPRIGFAFLLCCLGLAGFPITPTFIGEDLVFSHIDSGQSALLAIVSMSYVVSGLAVMRIYAKLFLGPSVRSGRQAYRSA